jgi:hypothetical protein
VSCEPPLDGSPERPPLATDVPEMLTQAAALLILAAIREEMHCWRKEMQRFVDSPRVVNYFEIRGDGVVSGKRGDIHFHDRVGAVAMDNAVQFVSEINQTLVPLQSDLATKPAADALKQLADAIAASKASEYERETHLRDVKMLSEQAALSKGERSTVMPALDRLAGFCSGTGGIATIWQVVGPPILALFS